MQEALRANIATLTTAYAAKTELAETTVLARATKDARFLERTKPGSKATFTIRVYEDAIRWFSAHWPADLEWPAKIERLEPEAEPENAA